MKLVISDGKTGKSFGKTVEDATTISGKKMGETIDLGQFGLSGFEAKIVGGSDAQGFPMRFDMAGTGRKKIFLTTDKKKGEKQRITRSGNTVGSQTSQLNLLVTKYGGKSLEELITPEKKDSQKENIKEQMIKQSLEVAGTAEAAKALAAEEFKKGERKR